MKVPQIIIALLILGLVGWGLSSLFQKDSYVGFYYPDANNLTDNVQSPGAFNTLESCRDWVDEQVSIYNPGGTGYDYECGKNCDLSAGQPYVCEETLE